MAQLLLTILVAALVYWICLALALPSIVGIVAALIVVLSGNIGSLPR